MHWIERSTASMSIARRAKSPKVRPSATKPKSSFAFAAWAATSFFVAGSAFVMRNASSDTRSIASPRAMRCSSFKSGVSTSSPCTMRFIDYVVPSESSSASCELLEELPDLVRPLLQVVVLHLDAHAVGAGQAVDARRLYQREHALGIDRRLRDEPHDDPAGRCVDLLHPERGALEAQLVAFEQHARGLRQRAEAEDRLPGKALPVLLGVAVGEPLVEHQSLVHVAAVGLGQQRRRMQVLFRR